MQLLSSVDLVARNTIYNGQHESNFLKKKCIPVTKGSESEHTPVRRTDEVKICKVMQMA